MNQATKVTPAVREEVARLLDIVLPGLSAANMAAISRMDLRSVEAALAAMAAAGNVSSKMVPLRGGAVELWVRK